MGLAGGGLQHRAATGGGSGLCRVPGALSRRGGHALPPAAGLRARRVPRRRHLHSHLQRAGLPSGQDHQRLQPPGVPRPLQGPRVAVRRQAPPPDARPGQAHGRGLLRPAQQRGRQGGQPKRRHGPHQLALRRDLRRRHDRPPRLLDADHPLLHRLRAPQRRPTGRATGQAGSTADAAVLPRPRCLPTCPLRRDEPSQRAGLLLPHRRGGQDGQQQRDLRRLQHRACPRGAGGRRWVLHGIDHRGLCHRPADRVGRLREPGAAYPACLGHHAAHLCRAHPAAHTLGPRRHCHGEKTWHHAPPRPVLGAKDELLELGGVLVFSHQELNLSSLAVALCRLYHTGV